MIQAESIYAIKRLTGTRQIDQLKIKARMPCMQGLDKEKYQSLCHHTHSASIQVY